MVPKGSNSGVYFMGRYEIQVYDSFRAAESEYPGIECGGIYQRWDNDRVRKGYEGRSPRVNASRPPEQWQTFDIIFRSPRFDNKGRKIANARFEKVVHNGTVVHADVELSGPTRASAYNDEKPAGPLMLQGDHGPVAYRNIRIEPAGPNPFFAMDTATKDDKHKTAKEQVEMVKELGYAGSGNWLHGGQRPDRNAAGTGQKRLETLRRLSRRQYRRRPAEIRPRIERDDRGIEGSQCNPMVVRQEQGT
jgi:hypothetical protein